MWHDTGGRQLFNCDSLTGFNQSLSSVHDFSNVTDHGLPDSAVGRGIPALGHSPQREIVSENWAAAGGSCVPPSAPHQPPDVAHNVRGDGTRTGEGLLSS